MKINKHNMPQIYTKPLPPARSQKKGEKIIPSATRDRIGTFIGHSIAMLKQLEEQNSTVFTAKKLDKIYQQATEKILKIQHRLESEIFLKRIQTKNESSKKLIENRIKIDKNNKKLISLQKKLKKLTQGNGNKKQIDQTNQKIAKTIQLLCKQNEIREELEYHQTHLSHNELKNLNHALKKAEDEVAEIIYDTQFDVLFTDTHLNNSDHPLEPKIKAKIANLSKGGLHALDIYSNAIHSDIDRLAIWHFHRAADTIRKNRVAMEQASKEAIPLHSDESEVNFDKRQEFEAYRRGKRSLDHRLGIIGVNGIYRIAPQFSKKRIKKQFQSFQAQRPGDFVRTTITKDIEIQGESFQTKLVPLNKEFDLALAARGILSNVFGTLFGQKGIPSSNRKEFHLINGWESTLQHRGRTIFRSLRHAITSPQFKGSFTSSLLKIASLFISLFSSLKINFISKNSPNHDAEELIKAALLQEIAQQGLSLQEASQQVVSLNFNSVSLVTPDSIRPYSPRSHDMNEQAMLETQSAALQSFRGQQSIVLDGIEIPVDIQINTFNFGVNVGAHKYNLGTEHQYKQNLEGIKGLRQQLVLLSKMIQQTDEDISSTHREEIQHLHKLAHSLMKDIQLLMKDKNAYLKGNHQYEIGAKILNLTNVMNQTVEIMNENRKPEDRFSGFTSAFNCMSGKDRTGIMDGVAKAFAAMSVLNGHYPTHEELSHQDVRRQFTDILVPILLEGGSLEITELNSGAKGYKVKEEARLCGLPLAEFLEIQGYSTTTGA